MITMVTLFISQVKSRLIFMRSMSQQNMLPTQLSDMPTYILLPCYFVGQIGCIMSFI